MLLILRLARLVQPDEQQDFGAGIGNRVHRLGEQRDRTRDRRGRTLRDRDAEVGRGGRYDRTQASDAAVRRRQLEPGNRHLPSVPDGGEVIATGRWAAAGERRPRGADRPRVRAAGGLTRVRIREAFRQGWW